VGPAVLRALHSVPTRRSSDLYYEQCKHPDSPAIRDPNPVVILYPGVGMFTFAKNKQTARVASEFYVNAVNVMRGSEAISTYTALDRKSTRLNSSHVKISYAVF